MEEELEITDKIFTEKLIVGFEEVIEILCPEELYKLGSKKLFNKILFFDKEQIIYAQMIKLSKGRELINALHFGFLTNNFADLHSIDEDSAAFEDLGQVYSDMSPISYREEYEEATALEKEAENKFRFSQIWFNLPGKTHPLKPIFYKEFIWLCEKFLINLKEIEENKGNKKLKKLVKNCLTERENILYNFEFHKLKRKKS